MSPASSPDQDRPDHPQAESAPDRDYFTEVPVYAGILHATAEMLELLHDFFSDADPATRTCLGRFLVARHPDEDTGDPGTEANLLVHELAEAADLLHALGGDVGDGTSG